MKKKHFLAIIVCFAISVSGTSQIVDSTSNLMIAADLVSSYVWRGVLSTASPTPNFQPSIAFVKGGLEIGAWGSSDFTGTYMETDLYVSFEKGPFKFTVTDYYCFNTSDPDLHYFNYSKEKTNHIFESSVAYSGAESYPVTIEANVMFAGADKLWNDDLDKQDSCKQAYSTYIELGYALKYFSPFIGITPYDGYYGDGYGGSIGFNVVNVGLTAGKSLKITDSYSLPIKTTLGFNPQKGGMYLVFGIAL